uniref:uncharacterized protein LOC122583409 n=1 Tax=Erigeron canadensis TaxID=72917 RepID=UPI001CB98D81|nr:uncharacterized protein LOC122583409 [Erigeron canadensis]
MGPTISGDVAANKHSPSSSIISFLLHIITFFIYKIRPSIPSSSLSRILFTPPTFSGVPESIFRRGFSGDFFPANKFSGQPVLRGTFFPVIYGKPVLGNSGELRGSSFPVNQFSDEIIVVEDTKEYIAQEPDEETKAHDRHPFDLMVILNPKLRKKSNKSALFFEGCLR